MPRNSASLRVGVVGATGMVGGELLALLESRRFPIGELLPFSSGRTRKGIFFQNQEYAAPAPDEVALGACDLVFFVSADEVSEALAPKLAAKGVWVIDDSSAFRLDPKVPLVIPEINPEALSAKKRLIAGPNCTMTGVALAAYPLHKKFGVRALRLASYQSVSGAGKAAVDELLAQARTHLRHIPESLTRAPILSEPSAAALPAASAFNVFPQVGEFGRDGLCSEERKVAAELRKIWGAPGLSVSAATVRVPVIRGHALTAWLEFSRAVSPKAAADLVGRAAGVHYRTHGYPTPLSCAGKDPVFAARLRQGTSAKELVVWIVSDNLLKGAALNSLQIAELLLKRGWL